MNNLTTEQIVAERLKIRDTMKSEIETIESYVSTDDVMMEMIRRDEYKAENTKIVNRLKEKIEDLERLSRSLREANTDTSNQNKRLERYKWDLLGQKKRLDP